MGEEVAEDLKARVNSVELFHKLFRTKNGLCPICGTPGSGVDCCYVDYETINREYSTLCDIFWEDAPKCECATNKWPCTKCGHEFSEAYDAGKCTRCTTGRATVGRCARCQDRPGVERHQCRSGRNCPCLGQKKPTLNVQAKKKNAHAQQISNAFHAHTTPTTAPDALQALSGHVLVTDAMEVGANYMNVIWDTLARVSVRETIANVDLRGGVWHPDTVTPPSSSGFCRRSGRPRPVIRRRSVHAREFTEL